jgi:hypothetical protein
MIPRILFFLALGAFPLAAQTGVDDESKVVPAQPPTVAPAAPTGAVIMQPGVTAPPPGAALVQPMMPAEPQKRVLIKEFTVVPGTVREGTIYRDAIKTDIVLTVPATRDFHVHVVTSDPTNVSCTDVPFIKGHMHSLGGIKISWHNFKHDLRITFKAYTDDNPELVFSARMYVIKKRL